MQIKSFLWIQASSSSPLLHVLAQASIKFEKVIHMTSLRASLGLKTKKQYGENAKNKIQLGS